MVLRLPKSASRKSKKERASSSKPSSPGVSQREKPREFIGTGLSSTMFEEYPGSPPSGSTRLRKRGSEGSV